MLLKLPSTYMIDSRLLPYPNYRAAGASHLLEALAFKSTQHRTHFRLMREVGVCMRACA